MFPTIGPLTWFPIRTYYSLMRGPTIKMELRSIFEKIIEPKLMNAADLALKSIPEP